MKRIAVPICLLLALSLAPTGAAAKWITIEDFESGNLDSYESVERPNTEVSSDFARHGDYGLGIGGAGYLWRGENEDLIRPGDTFSIWMNTGRGWWSEGEIPAGIRAFGFGHDREDGNNRLTVEIWGDRQENGLLLAERKRSVTR